MTAHAVDTNRPRSLGARINWEEALNEWILGDPVCANLTLADYMQDQIYKDESSEIIGSKNQLGGSFKRIDSLECHCRMGHRG